MNKLLVLSVLLAATGGVQAADLYKCTGGGNPISYTRSPIPGMSCRVISSYTEPGVRLGVGAPTILSQCRDKDSLPYQGPSARARECTRLHCGKASYQAIVEGYALGRAQTPEQQATALTCISRRESDLKTR